MKLKVEMGKEIGELRDDDSMAVLGDDNTVLYDIALHIVRPLKQGGFSPPIRAVASLNLPAQMVSVVGFFSAIANLPVDLIRTGNISIRLEEQISVLPDAISLR